MNDMYQDQRISVMDLKIASIYYNFVWKFVNRPYTVQSIVCKWIYKRKWDQISKVQTFKA